MLACIRAFSELGMTARSCKIIDMRSNGEYKPSTVYDFDTTSESWREIVKVLSSKSIGSTTKILHNEELDFGTASSRIAGAVAYGSDRSITWYLMESQKIPNICNSTPECLYYERNSNGFFSVPIEHIQMNRVYFTCAWANATRIHREFFTEVLDEIKECSNGFVLDDMPPSPGHVDVKNEEGYLTDLSMVSIEWDGFTDNIDATVLGYIDSIREYSYSVGRRPKGDDIKNFTSVGLSKSVTETKINVENGAVVFITVKATDHSGLSSMAVSKALLVDTTPPVVGEVVVDCHGADTVVCSSSNIPFQLIGFKDIESGIESFEVMVGSLCGISNVALETFTGEYGEITLSSNSAYEGHTLCFIIKAKNRAGLVSHSTSQQFQLDTSPPTGGHVIDGEKGIKMDLDYQEDITYITAHWRGFDDAHSSIRYYRVGLGLKPFDDDVCSMTNVGLQTDITWNSTFIPGIKYFTTVEACNQAGLCARKVSDGLILDNSPPIRGLIKVGHENVHMKYLQSGSLVHLRWFGFEDPQSDIDHFDACIGTSAGDCDVLPFFPCLLQSNVIKSGLNLQDMQNYYATVRAYNKVGLTVQQTSDAFRIDSTPPEVSLIPTFNTNQKSIPGFSVQWEKSVLTIDWKFIDNESPITHQRVTLKTNHEGHAPVELLDVGPANTVTIQLDKEQWLNDGDKYVAVVTSCNAAGLCSVAESSDLLIDSTPPFLGGFKPPLAWNNFKTNTGEVVSTALLTWYGFHDAESNIDSYYMSVSHSYNGNELTSGVIKVTETELHNLDQHQVNITLKEQIFPDDKLILTIWAGNMAGLNSSVARISVNALSTISNITDTSSLVGVLEIEKHSCDIHFCNKDCTCAVLGQPCVDVISNTTCITLDAAKHNRFPQIDVFGGLVVEKRNITASSACLTAHWLVINQSTNGTIERFEWSIGLLGQPIGGGVFDLKKVNPWNDVGYQQEIVYCLKDDLNLIHGERYIVYVKVWYSKDTSRIFTSAPIQIDHTSPQIRRGEYVSDSDGSCNEDYDYIDWTDGITGCWENVFSEQQGRILHYTVSLGTSPKADDIYPTTDVGLSTAKTMDNVHFHPGTKYYITVTAYNNVGLHTTSCSDGFVVDTDKPIRGVVFNTEGHIDTLFQYDTGRFSISWHGYQDHFAGIRFYSVALVDHLNFELDEPIFTNAGLRTKHTFSGLQLVHGKIYYALVKASDAAGHVSNVSVSRGKTIDTTPPEGVHCSEYYEKERLEIHLLDEMSTETVGYNFTYGHVYNIRARLSLSHVRIKLMTDENSIVMPEVASEDGSYTFHHIFIPKSSNWVNISIRTDHRTNATVELTINSCEPGTSSNSSVLHMEQFGRNSLKIYLPVIDIESGISKVTIGVGTTPGGFQIKQLSPVHPAITNTVDVEVPHGTTLYATAIAENHAGLRSEFHSRPVILDKTPPAITRTPALKVEMNEVGNISGSDAAVIVTWRVEDKESRVKTCLCSLGHYAGSPDIRPFVESSILGYSTFMNVSVFHGDVLHATVRCVNERGLFSESTSRPVIISTEKPDHTLARLNIVNLNVNTDDINIARQDDVAINLQSNRSCLQLEWHGFSDFSGIEEYEYRLLHDGVVEEGWTSSGKQTMATMTNLSMLPGQVYSAEIRAINSGRHVSDSTSANVLIVAEPSLTGHPMEMHQSATNIMLDWGKVFKTDNNAPCLYDLTVGTSAGYNDVTDKEALRTSTFDVVVETSMKVGKVDEVFVSVTCRLVTGASETFNTRFALF